MYAKTYTLQEFLQLQRNRQLNSLDRSILHFKKNKTLYDQLIVIAAVLALKSNITFASSKGIDALGHRLLSKIQMVAFWVVVIKGSIDILQKLISGDFEGAKKVFAQYILIFGFLLAFPWALRQVKETFGSL